MRILLQSQYYYTYYLFFTLVLFKKQMTQSSFLVLEFILSCLHKKNLLYMSLISTLTFQHHLYSYRTQLTPVPAASLYLKEPMFAQLRLSRPQFSLRLPRHELNYSVSFERKWVMMVVVQSGNAKIKYRKKLNHEIATQFFFA